MHSHDQLAQPLPAFPPRAVLEALDLLRRAAHYAADTGVDAWQFAVEESELTRVGLTRTDLRWLLHKNLAHHARETTPPGSPDRSFAALPRTSLTPDAAFVLTPCGLSLCDSLLVFTPTGCDAAPPIAPTPFPNPHPITPAPPLASSAGNASPIPTGAAFAAPSANDKPHWDPNRRELRFRGQVVKRYRVPAPNQELILTAFEEDGWPDWIDDPLPPRPDVEPSQRLRQTVKQLNKHHVLECIRFSGNGGERVLWSGFLQPNP